MLLVGLVAGWLAGRIVRGAGFGFAVSVRAVKPYTPSRGLDPRVHVLPARLLKKDVGGRVKPGHGAWRAATGTDSALTEDTPPAAAVHRAAGNRLLLKSTITEDTA
jgi:hypothetical protein